MFDKLIKYKFEIFLLSQLVAIFGGLILPSQLFHNLGYPLGFFVNLMAGILLFRKSKSVMVTGFVLVFIFGMSILAELFIADYFIVTVVIRGLVILVFYYFVSLQIIRQVWNSKVVSKVEIVGLMSGYICLGFIGYFILLIIEGIYPGSIHGLPAEGAMNLYEKTDQLMYFSYITLLTIGYGDMLPMTELTRNTTILIGLVGQFYIAIVTGTIVGKLVNQFNASVENE